MNGLKVFITCVLLEMTFDLLAAQHLKRGRCQTCPQGYFVLTNCSEVSNMRHVGVRCSPCTNCSAAHRDTLVQCSTFADSLCENKTTPAVTSTPTEPPDSAPGLWIILAVIVCSLFLVLLLSLFLTLLAYRNHQRNHQQNKLKGNRPLPPDNKPLPSYDRPLPPVNKPLPSDIRPLPPNNKPLPPCDSPCGLLCKSGSAVTELDLIISHRSASTPLGSDPALKKTTMCGRTVVQV
ncbi:uncharacterized protein LOC141763717 [Sebastes fasciatus]|uniref:uncharacterized protein LOC141763717 n=1 Tax=Sebastes fasciatus TaxID=394691 RepID=UPI003D9F8EC5